MPTGMKKVGGQWIPFSVMTEKDLPNKVMMPFAKPQKGPMLKKDLPRKVFQGFDPELNLVSPPIAMKPKLNHETAKASVLPVTVASAQFSVQKSVTPGIPIIVGAGVTIAAIVRMLLLLSLTVGQKQAAAFLTKRGVPQAVAILIATTAPWMVDNWVIVTSPKVAVYRLTKLIGTVSLDDWVKFASTMAVEIRNQYRIRESEG